MSETATISTLAGDGSFLAYCARPEGEPRGAIVVIQEIFGVNAGIRSKCDRLAADEALRYLDAMHGLLRAVKAEAEAKAVHRLWDEQGRAGFAAPPAAASLAPSVPAVPPAGRPGRAERPPPAQEPTVTRRPLALTGLLLLAWQPAGGRLRTRGDVGNVGNVTLEVLVLALGVLVAVAICVLVLSSSLIDTMPSRS